MTQPGQFSVNQTGTATYAMPIALPPGTAGVVPSLSLEYSSHAPNGLLGMGWELGGLPSIGRCPRTVAQDGVLGGINYDANDRFCMDGQRLVAISGTYGADGTQYRTEIESFSKIISHGVAGTGPAWFEVHTKSGQVMEFGNTTDSRVLAQGKSTAAVWTLDKLSDSKTNYFTVTYTNDTANGQFYPSRIDYTGNGAASVAPYNSVQFVYGSRSDVYPQYQAGSLSQTTVRLTDIKAYAGATLVSDYHLTYGTSSGTGRSRLTSVQTCDGASSPNCLPATTFSWQDTAFGFSSPSFATGNTFNSLGSTTIYNPVCGTDTCTFYSDVPNGPGLIALDLNGDGKTDFVQQEYGNGFLYLITYLSNGSGGYTGTAIATGAGFDTMGGGRGPGLMAVDFDGDGRSDLVQQWKDDSGNLRFILYRSNGDGTFSQSIAPSNGVPFETAGPTATPGPGLIALDLNGDGRTDFIQQDDTASGTLSFFVYLSNGDGTFTESYQSTSGGFTSNGSGPGLIAADLNGDGKTDLVQQCNCNGTLYLVALLSNGDGTFTSVTTETGSGYASAGSDPGIIAADINGDGKTDLIQQYNNAGVFYVITYLSKGDGTFVQGSQNLGVEFNTTANGPGLMPIDLNGDGKADLIQQYNNNGRLNIFPYLSNGNGTFTASGVQDLGTVYDTTGQGMPGLMPADLAGIGKAGLVIQYNDNANLDLIGRIPTAPYPDLLSTITTGLGAVTTITYAPLTSSSVYTKDSTATYPVQDLQLPLYVVSRVDVSNGVGGTYSSTYSYAGAKADLSGRGFLNFRQMTVTDLQTGIADTTSYRQDFPYIGLVASTSRSLGTQTLGQSTNTYQFTNASGSTTISVAGSPYQVSLSQNISSGTDLDGTALPTVGTTNQYDSYGNATQVVVQTSDGYGKTTNNTYTNDTTNWYLGRLTASTVISVAPQQLGQYCPLPWGGTIASGQSVTAYSAANGPVGQACSTIAQTRTCTHGSLSGSYTQQSCTAVCALPWGGTITQGQSVTAYSAAFVPATQTCSSVAQTRTCGADGILTGSFTHQSCEVSQPKIVLLTSGSTWTVPSDWSNTHNTVECIGGGGGGARAAGGGGGAYAQAQNMPLTVGTTVTYNVGGAGLGAGAGSSGGTGGDTWFNATSLSDSVAKGGTLTCGAQGGSGGTDLSPYSTGGGLGGATAVGLIEHSGGQGGSEYLLAGAPFDGGGGGGAAGPNGNGNAASDSSYVGAAGDAGYGGAGGGSYGAAGGNGTEIITGSYGSGGGGAGSAGATDTQPATSGNGGYYGGGGAGGAQNNGTGADGVGGTGAQGAIIITYTPGT